MDSITSLICEISSLKILKIEIDYDVHASPLVEILGDHLTFVEYLLFDFYIDLQSFEYFASKCKANLKKWAICIDSNPVFLSLRKDYLVCVNNYQKVHNSLKMFGINKHRSNWTSEELEIINSLKNQGVDIVDILFDMFDI